MHILSAAFGWGRPSEGKLQSLNTWTPHRLAEDAPHAG
jgi:hypothetical protein